MGLEATPGINRAAGNEENALPHGRSRDRLGRASSETFDASSRPSTGTYGGRRDAPSTAHSPFSVSPRIRRSDMRRSVSGFGSVSRIQRRSGGIFSSWSPLTGESQASSAAGGNNGNRNDSCQAPFGVGDLAVPEIPQNTVGVMAQNQCRLHKNPTTRCGHKSVTGRFRPNRICI